MGEYVYLGIRTIYHSSFEVGKWVGIKHLKKTLEVGEIRVIWEIAIYAKNSAATKRMFASSVAAIICAD